MREPMREMGEMKKIQMMATNLRTFFRQPVRCIRLPVNNTFKKLNGLLVLIHTASTVLCSSGRNCAGVMAMLTKSPYVIPAKAVTQ